MDSLPDEIILEIYKCEIFWKCLVENINNAYDYGKIFSIDKMVIKHEFINMNQIHWSHNLILE